MSEVVGLFKSRMTAEDAVDQLYSLGYDATRVGFLDRNMDETGVVRAESGFDRDVTDDDTGDTAEETAKGIGGGAGGGAVVGASAGLLASAGMLAIPGIGPFLAAGTLAATLGAATAGAVGGAAVGGVAGAIFGATANDDEQIADERATYYREGVDRGSSLVTVEVLPGQENEVGAILLEAGAEKVDVYGDGGWMV
jgi:hypothetical protein